MTKSWVIQSRMWTNKTPIRQTTAILDTRVQTYTPPPSMASPIPISNQEKRTACLPNSSIYQTAPRIAAKSNKKAPK